jgi:excisionase family DNA binding protein
LLDTAGDDAETTNMTRWYSTEEIGVILGVTSETVRRLIRARRLAATVFLGGERPTFRISQEALDEYRRRFTRDSLRDDWE